MKNIVLTLSLAFLLIGCSTKTIYKRDSFNYNKSFPVKSSNYKINKNYDYNKLYDAFYLQYKQWKGVSYKYGGTTKKGIDCSAFVQNTFKTKLHIKIPRTTKYQAKDGIEVEMSQLQIGDLIFFKTGFNTRHVGIYLGNGKFLHASTKYGVTISHLDTQYYQDSFWKIKRIIF